MDTIDLNELLERKIQENTFKDALLHFEQHKQDLSVGRGFYVYGNSGVGKTSFVKSILSSLNYDIITYDSSDTRNVQLIDSISKKNMSDTNVLSLFYKKPRKIAIIFDEIDTMNNGDKGTISALIKLIRPKKTKKQHLEDYTMNPVICIGNYQNEKKFKELMKVTTSIELKQPTIQHTQTILSKLLTTIDKNILNEMSNMIQGDLRKIYNAYILYTNSPEIIQQQYLEYLFQDKTFNEDTKQLTKKLINEPVSFEDHTLYMNETDRTSTSLLYHENIIDVIQNCDFQKSNSVYLDILDGFCYGDYIDRLSFQKQVWIFKEISSLIKTFHTNYKYFQTFHKPKKYNPKEVRFTKILTKYSTEYGNQTFIQRLCCSLNMDIKDMLSFFVYIREVMNMDEIFRIMEKYEISTLDVKRLYKFIDNYILGMDYFLSKSTTPSKKKNNANDNDTITTSKTNVSKKSNKTNDC